MSNQTPQANIDLFNQAKEHYLPKELINRAQTGSISERIRFILSVKSVSINQTCRLCSISKRDVITFLFKYEHNLIIYTHYENHCYYFTTSKGIINHLKSLNDEY